MATRPVSPRRWFEPASTPASRGTLAVNGPALSASGLTARLSAPIGAGMVLISQYFEDNDRSAYSGKKRPAYERMLAAIQDRRLDAVVTWHNDRLHRSPRELEAFIDLVERSGVRVALRHAVPSRGDQRRFHRARRRPR